MSSEVSEVLNTLGEKFGLFVDWSQQNVQPYIEDLMQRVVQYKFASNICCLIFMILVMIINVFSISRFVKMKNNNKITIDNEDWELALLIISIVCLIVLTILSIFIIEYLFKCHYIPEMVFIEEIKSLMK